MLTNSVVCVLGRAECCIEVYRRACDGSKLLEHVSDEARHTFVVSIFLFCGLFALSLVTALRSKQQWSEPGNLSTSPARAPAVPVTKLPAPAKSAAMVSATPPAAAPTAIVSAAPVIVSAVEPAKTPELQSALSKYEPYAPRLKTAQTNRQFSNAVKEFSRGLTPAERVAFGRFIAEDTSGDLTKDHILLLIALIQGPLPEGPERAQLDEVFRQVQANHPAEGAQTAAPAASK